MVLLTISIATSIIEIYMSTVGLFYLYFTCKIMKVSNKPTRCACHR